MPALRLPWPLPALLGWSLAWGGFAAVQAAAIDVVAWAWLLAALVGGVVAASVKGRWRRLLVVAGFPLSSLALGATAPAWVWLLAALLLLLAYPLRAWADAPFFPTPVKALQGLADAVPLPAGASVLDAGCGLGHGLKALRAVWPAAQIEGVEWSAPMAWLCQRRCRFAQVRRGDMWLPAWTDHTLVYLFQRPESMARAWAKVCAEMAPGTYLVSLEFAVPDVVPTLRLDAGAGRPLWVYRVEAAAKQAAPSKMTRRGR